MNSQNDPYKELYNLALKAYDEQHNRYLYFTDKAFKFLTIVGVIIGIFTYIGKFLHDEFIPPQNLFAWIILIVSFITFIVLISTWFVFLSALKIREFKILPLTEESINFYSNNRLNQIYYSMTVGIKKALDDNSIVFDDFSKRMEIGYKLITILACLFIISLILFILNKFNIF